MPWRRLVARLRPREAARRELTVLTRAGCHLCEEMLETVRGVGDAEGLAVTVRDIDVERDEGRMSADEHDRWTTEVPVLLVDGRPVARWRATAAQVRDALAAHRSP